MVPCNSEVNDFEWSGMIDKEISVAELEYHLFCFEQVRVIFRLDKNKVLPEYPYKTPVGDASYLQSLHDRLDKTYSETNFVIVDGEGLFPGLKLKKLKQVRMSYVK